MKYKKKNIDVSAVNTSASYTLVNTDINNVLPFSNAATVVTVNTDSITRIGDVIYVEYEGTGTCEIKAGTATLRKNENDSLFADGKYSRIAVQKVTATDYKVFGELTKEVLNYHEFACSDEATDLEVGMAYTQVMQRNLGTVTRIDFSVSVAPSGSSIEVNVLKNGVSVFSQLPVIEVGHVSTIQSSVQQQLVGGEFTLSTLDKIEVEINQVGSTYTGLGMKAQITYKQ